MSDLRDFTGKNRVFTGTDSITTPAGTTAERVNGTAKLRFNSTTNLMEYYTGTDWKSIDSPPLITNFTVDGGSDVTSANIDGSASGNATIQVKGSLFDTTGATVTFVGTSETLSTESITRNSGNLLTVTVQRSSFDNTNEPYAIKVTNGSGLSATLADAITQDRSPVFTNAADTNFDVFDSLRSSGTIAASSLCGATDPDSDTITYSVSSGSLPSGFTLNTSTGAITYSSVSAVGSDTETAFTIQAATSTASATRQFKITVKAPQATSFTSTGAQTFSVPAALSAVDVLVIAGGGTGGNQHGGGGGAGGLIYRPGFSVTGGSPVSLNVGAGGNGMPQATSNGTHPGGNGNNTTFSTLTAIGGGQGPSHNGGGGLAGQPGGSGGGGNSDPTGSPPGGTGVQPTQSGDSGTYGFGNPGGSGHPSSPWVGGGGGGAGGAGENTPGGRGGNGGSGKSYNISGSSVTYAGGGGGGGHNASGGAAGSGGGGAGGGPAPGVGAGGTANRGGGAGGSASGGVDVTNPGGSGVVIVKF